MFIRMDRRLLEAARTGNLQQLHKLIEDDPLMLNTVALAGGETPLHIACTAGHHNFVKEIIQLRKQSAEELNQNGLSPLHIASGNGNIEIVEELLTIDHHLCLLKGREQWIPLHYASVKGRLQVMRELLAASADSVAEVTAKGETALHLAVKNYQFEALKILMEHLKRIGKEDILNKKDEQGNTILHLATSRKQFEVIDLMHKNQVLARIAEVNSLNKEGLTPLDALLIFESEAGDREIEGMLRLNGALRARDMPSLPQPLTLNHQNGAAETDDQSRTAQAQSPAKGLIYYFTYDHIRDSPSKVRNTLLVIAVLIATATYQAVLSPPGGVWQDDAGSHTAGESIMGFHKPVSYRIFLFCNSVGFFTSLHMINVLTYGFPMRLELQISMLALVLTYDTSMTTIAPSSRISTYFTVISAVLPFVMPILTVPARNYLKRPNSEAPVTEEAVA
ncbi:hypothetical protein ACH5RR_000460 [Cinchona calisaya]|uniref:PGG domain-containing protein n=1 Tax=Cinchona calisaya TaxID=153742 RepID=A0ABD3B1Q3_9GENT